MAMTEACIHDADIQVVTATAPSVLRAILTPNWVVNFGRAPPTLELGPTARAKLTAGTSYRYEVKVQLVRWYRPAEFSTSQVPQENSKLQLGPSVS